MDMLMSVPGRLKAFRVCHLCDSHIQLWLIALQETRLSALRPVGEFFDHHRLSRPADMNQATSVSRTVPVHP